MCRTVWVRRIRRWVRRRGQFYLAVVFTVVVVAYVVVPWIVQLAETVGGYNPTYYEPKDEARLDYLRSLPGLRQTLIGWETTFKLLLLVLAGFLWIIAFPGSLGRGSRSSRR